MFVAISLLIIVTPGPDTVFFVSVFPQFTTPHEGMFAASMLLGALFCALTLGRLAVYAAAVSAMGGLLRRPEVRRTVEGMTGALLIGLGVRVAAHAR
jgi:threonine/homoserine/homoserine lactone efflux protein